jgi:hypothetical protein
MKKSVPAVIAVIGGLLIIAFLGWAFSLHGTIGCTGQRFFALISTSSAHRAGPAGGGWFPAMAKGPGEKGLPLAGRHRYRPYGPGRHHTNRGFPAPRRGVIRRYR